MNDRECICFLQWALPQLQMRWPGFRKVRKQVCKRLQRRLHQLNLPNTAAYRAYLAANPNEWEVLDSYCRITISRFYRDRAVFDYLRQSLLPELARTAIADKQNELRCWSAGCASGEEAYTLNILWALSMQSHFPDLALHIVATDVDANLLERARIGCYPFGSFKDFPHEWLLRAFTLSQQQLCIRAEFREGIEFLKQDIRSQSPEGSFHLLLCRNLAFTYFDLPLQLKVLQRLVRHLLPGGSLVLGSHEELHEVPPELQQVRPRLGIYRRSTGTEGSRVESIRHNNLQAE